MSLFLIALVLLVLLILAAGLWLTGSLVALVLHLFVAGVIGALAQTIFPGRLPGGWLGAVVAGVAGSWLGTRLLGNVGPSLFGVTIIPAFLGALVLVGLVSVLARPTVD